MLWDGIGDIIITSNVNNIFQGPIYRTIDYILQVSVLVELQLVVDQWTNTEACYLEAHTALRLRSDWLIQFIFYNLANQSVQDFI